MDNLQGVSVHTGFPNAGTDSSLQALNLNKLLVAHGASTYYMQVAGNSWRSMAIFSGDIVIVDRALKARPNDLVVWWLDDSFELSPQHKVPIDAVVFGVITSTIHQFRNSPNL